MSRARTIEGLYSAAEAALALIGDLSAEPTCVRVAATVKLTGIPRSTLYELINLKRQRSVDPASIGTASQAGRI